MLSEEKMTKEQEMNKKLLMRRDYGYALEQLGWDEELSVKEFVHIVEKLNKLGWNVSYNYLIQYFVDDFMED